MDKISKNLQRIPGKQRREVLAAAKQVRSNDFSGLDIKKLKGNQNLFRVRVGRYRIVLQKRPGLNPVVIAITKRDDQTYRKP